MKKRDKIVVLASVVLVGLAMTFAAYWLWGRNKLEIQIQSTRRSSDDKWTAVVQMEVHSAPAFVNDAVYAVRLKGPAQKDRLGDLVMNTPVNYPDPAPTIDWSGGKLVVTLADHEKYQYLATTPIDGITVTLQQK
jgi:hypothetical protein